MTLLARPLIQRLVRLAGPVLVAQLAIIANGVIDTLMVGQRSATELAAVGLGASVYLTVHVGLLGVIMALAPIAGQHFGAQRYTEIGADVRQTLFLALALSGPGYFIVNASDLWINLAQPDPAIAPQLKAYLHAAAWSLPAAMASRVFLALNSAIARPAIAMAINIAAVALKWPLNQLFMEGQPHLGIPAFGGAGCALATALLSWLSLVAVASITYFDPHYRRFEIFQRGWLPWTPRGAALKQLLALGIPMGLAYLVEVSSFTFMAILVARLGTTSQAAHQIASNLAGATYMVPLAIASATLTLTSHAVGAKDLGLARNTALTGLRLAGFSAIVIALCLVIFRTPLAQAYTQDTAVAAAVIGILPWVASYHAFDAIQCVLAFTLRAWKITTLPLWIYVLALWGVGLGVGAILGLGLLSNPALGVNGFWMAATLSVFVASALLGLLLRRTFSNQVRSSAA